MKVLRAFTSAALIGIGLTVGTMTAAFAGTPVSATQCGDVGCVAPSTSAQPKAGAQVSATTQDTTAPSTAASTGSLAFTGADIAEFTLLALAAIALGSLLILSSRKARRRSGALP